MSTIDVKSKRATVLPSQLRKGSSAHRIYHAAAAQGWDLDLHGVLTHDGKEVAYHVLHIVWEAAPDRHVTRYEIEFDATTGGMWSVKRFLVPDESQRRLSRNDPKPYRHPGDRANMKVSTIVEALGHGPIWRKAQEAEQAEKAALAAARHKVHEEERRIVGSQAVMRDLMVTIKNERNYSVKELRNNLEAIIERATEALKGLDQGQVPNGNFPVMGQAGYQVDKHAGEAWALSLQVDRMESMFGPVTEADGYIYHQWQSSLEKARAEKAAEGDG